MNNFAGRLGLFIAISYLTACSSPSEQSIASDKIAAVSEAADSKAIVYVLPKLPYAYPDLEPSVDARTMEIHYDKHHRAYVDNLNKALVGTPWATKPLEEILASASKLPDAIRNNAGGHFNHSLFWTVMAPVSKGGGVLKKGALENAIKNDFGSVKALKEEFTKAAVSRFGSGWAWLVVTPSGKLAITSTNAQDNPLMDIADVVKGTPVLGLDVWEHAYYLKYQNRRPDYITAWWKIVNWKEVESRFARATKK